VLVKHYELTRLGSISFASSFQSNQMLTTSFTITKSSFTLDISKPQDPSKLELNSSHLQTRQSSIYNTSIYHTPVYYPSTYHPSTTPTTNYQPDCWFLVFFKSTWGSDFRIRTITQGCRSTQQTTLSGLSLEVKVGATKDLVVTRQSSSPTQYISSLEKSQKGTMPNQTDDNGGFLFSSTLAKGISYKRSSNNMGG
jgi:hypothetical protein